MERTSCHRMTKASASVATAAGYRRPTAHHSPRTIPLLRQRNLHERLADHADQPVVAGIDGGAAQAGKLGIGKLPLEGPVRVEHDDAAVTTVGQVEGAALRVVQERLRGGRRLVDAGELELQLLAVGEVADAAVLT